MNRKFVFGCVVALAVMFSACDKDQDVAMQHDDAATVELKSVVLTPGGKAVPEKALEFAKIDMDGKTFGDMTRYNGNKRIQIGETGVFIEKGASINWNGVDIDLTGSNGNGNTTWVLFSDDAVGIITIAYKWGNDYRAWKFDASKVAGKIFVFDGRPLSGIAYGEYIPCILDVSALEREIKSAEAFLLTIGVDDEKCWDGLANLRLTIARVGYLLDETDCELEGEVRQATQDVKAAYDAVEKVSYFVTTTTTDVTRTTVAQRRGHSPSNALWVAFIQKYLTGADYAAFASNNSSGTLIVFEIDVVTTKEDVCWGEEGSIEEKSIEVWHWDRSGTHGTRTADFVDKDGNKYSITYTHTNSGFNSYDDYWFNGIEIVLSTPQAENIVKFVRLNQ